MASQWYYAKGQEIHGPFTVSTFRELAAAGMFCPEDLVWNDELPDRFPASRIKDLFSKTKSELPPSMPPLPVENEASLPARWTPPRRAGQQSLLIFLVGTFLGCAVIAGWMFHSRWTFKSDSKFSSDDEPKQVVANKPDIEPQLLQPKPRNLIRQQEEQLQIPPQQQERQKLVAEQESTQTEPNSPSSLPNSEINRNRKFSKSNAPQPPVNFEKDLVVQEHRQPRQWQTFRHPKGVGQIDMPGPVELNSDNGIVPPEPGVMRDLSKLPTKMKLDHPVTYTAKADDLICSLRVSKLSPYVRAETKQGSAKFKKTAELLLKLQKSWVEYEIRNNARLISDVPLSMKDEAYGREFQIDTQSGNVFSRTFFTRTHEITATIVLSKHRDSTADKNRFFRSMKIEQTKQD